MFFFLIIERVIIYENGCSYPTTDTKQFSLILINQYVEVLLILVYSKIYDHFPYTHIVIKNIFLILFTNYKNERKGRKFWRQQNQNKWFLQNRKATNIDAIDVNKILVSKEEPYDTKILFKYFIRYNDNDVIRSLCTKLPKTNGYVRKFESNTTMPFKISDKKTVKKQNQIWKKVKSLLNIKSDSEPVHGDNDKCIKAKIKKFGGNVNTNFQGKGKPKKAPYKCLSIIMLDSVVKVKKNVLSSNDFGRM